MHVAGDGGATGSSPDASPNFGRSPDDSARASRRANQVVKSVPGEESIDAASAMSLILGRRRLQPHETPA